MIQPSVADITAQRHAPFSYAMLFKGIDLSAATFKMQVRLYADAPGDPLIALANAAAGSEGVSATFDGTDTNVVSRIEQAALEALPAPSPAAADAIFAFDLHITPPGGVEGVYRKGGFIVQGAATLPAPFSPAALFTGGIVGAWYDPSDLTTVFQDDAGTTPAAVGDLVGRINDKSGNGHHATMSDDLHKPYLRQDGGGKYYLEFDRANDGLQALFTLTTPLDRISAINQTNWTANYLFDGGADDRAALIGNPSSPSLSMYSGSYGATTSAAAVGTTTVLTERFAGPASQIRANGGAWSSGSTGTTGAVGGITIGRYFGAVNFGANFHLYGLVVRQGGDMTDAQLAETEAWIAAKAGVTL